MMAVKNLVYKVKVAFLLTPLMLFGGVSAFTVVPTAQVCSNPTSPSGPAASYYIPPNNDINGDGRSDIVLNYACNAVVAQQNPGNPNVYYNFLYNDPNSVIRYYADNGSNNIFYRNTPSVVNFSVADVTSRTVFSTPAISSSKYFRIYDTYNSGHLLSTPTVASQNDVSMECNFVARQHIPGGGVTLNGLVYENPNSGYLGFPIPTGPLTVNNLLANPNTVSVRLCDYANLHRCGDGIVDVGGFSNGTFSEQCDPATQAGGVPVGVAPGNTCNANCTETANAFCVVGSPTIQTSTATNPSTALDNQDITFSCNTVNNPGGSIRIRRNGTIFSTTLGNGPVTINNTTTTLGDFWEAECLNAGGNILGFASVAGSCERTISIVANGAPTCTPLMQIGPGGAGEAGQISFVPAGTLLNYYCSFTNYITATPPDGINLVTPLANVPLLPLFSGIVGPDSFLGYTGVAPTTTPGQYSIVCNWYEGPVCEHSFWVGDPSITKFQSTGANLVAPTYGINNTQNGAPSFMSLNGATRIYYRLDAQDVGGGFTGLIADTMPSISGLNFCYLDYTRTSPQVEELTVFNGVYGSGEMIIWYVPDQGQLMDVQIVYYCDIPQLTQPYQIFNTGGLWMNQMFTGFFQLLPTYDTSNTVAAQYLPIPSLQLNKYQGTGWTIIGDYQGLGITNQQTVGNPMDITGLTGIAYRLHVYNPGLALDTINITDTFPAGLSCQIRNVLTNHVGSHTNYVSFPVPVTTSLWSGQNFLQGDEVTIIVNCDVPVIADVYDNSFNVDITLNGANTQFVSNIVVAERKPTVLFVDKLQRNVTNNTPATGAFGSGALTYRSGDVFAFQLHYGNNSSGAITDVELTDTFPSGFLLQSSSLTGVGFSCDGASPVIFPVLVEDCTWNLGTLAVNQSGTIYLTGVMTIDTPMFYYNTGSIYSSGVLLDQSIVQQIPNIITGNPRLDVVKRQVTAINTGFNDTSCNPIGCAPTLLNITTQNNYYMQYVITVTNNGSGTAANVQIADTLPQGFIPTTSAPTYSGTVPGICANYGAPSSSGHFSFQCTPSTSLPASGVVQITVIGQVTTDASGIGGSGSISSYSNTASAISSTTGANCTYHYPAAPYCASNTVIATIPSAPYLTINKYFREASAEPGDIVHFTIEYQNAGSAAAQNVYILDVMPNGLNYISHLPVPPTYSGNGQFWLSGALGVSAVSGVLNVTAQVSTGFLGTGITNTAQICASNVVGCPSDSAFLPIVFTTGFDIIKSAQVSGVNVTGVVAGSTLTYVLDFINNGNTSLLYYEITDMLPPTVTYVNGSAQARLNGGVFQSAAPNQSSGSLIWTCANGSSATLPNPCTLPAGGTGQVRFNVIVN